MNAKDQKDYTILGRSYCQRELSVLRCQRLSVTEAWHVMTAGDATGLEIYMSPEQCSEFFNAVLIPVVDGQPKYEQFPEFKPEDFHRITVSEVGEVFGHFCFFNPVLAQSLVALTGLWQALDGLQTEAGAGPVGAQSTGNTSRQQPAGATLPN